jgi:hypothetical protein
VALELFSSGTAVANYDLIKTSYSVPSGAGVLGSLKAAVTVLRLISYVLPSTCYLWCVVVYAAA